MREALNSNPLVQLAVVAVLLVGTGFFVLSSGGGGGEEESEATTSTATTTAPEGGSVTTEVQTDPGGSAETLSAALSTAGGGSIPAPPLPRSVRDAWRANQTLVLLFVRDGGIDDRLVKTATTSLTGFANASVTVVPAAKISRYAAITDGVGVDRVPALVVVTPKNLKKTVPTASVSYGFQSPESVSQAVIDAGYEGPTIDYHP